MTWQNSVCMIQGRIVCSDINALVKVTTPNKSSAIDNFYASTHEILTKLPPAFFASYSEDIVGLVFVGLISATENYFRDILGFILSTCPISQSHSADEKIQLGSLLWSNAELHNRTAFEFMAFSSADNINKTINNFTSYQIKKNGTWDAMLKEYDKLCELRHAVVHSGHIVAGKNAVKLGLNRTTKPLRVSISYAKLQEAGGICTALIQAANNELFEMMVQRWAEKWRALPSWKNSHSDRLFSTLYNAFLSIRDKQNKAISNQQSKNRLMTQIKTAYNL